MNGQTRMTRRQAIRTSAAAAGASLFLPAWLGRFAPSGVAQAAARCALLTPELTEGPYWVNTMLRRADVRANTATAATSPHLVQAGVPLRLTINVLDAAAGCAPLNGVAVDIWHANAHGLYSDEASQQTGGGTAATDTSGQNFLRGYQLTGRDAGIHPAPRDGQVSFRTIWPGWYSGRAIHIHVRVRELSHGGATIAGYTTQIFFADADNNRVLTAAGPYDARSPQTDATNDENDSVLQSVDRATNIVAVTGSLGGGFAATFNVMLKRSQVGAKGSLGRPSNGGAPPGPAGGA